MTDLQPLALIPDDALAQVAFLLTDVDDTLTQAGQLTAPTLAAMEDLRAIGLRIVPITAASAGWCSLMAHMWPVDAVIGENGGVCLSTTEHQVRRQLWADDRGQRNALAELRQTMMAAFPFLQPSEDSDYRLASIAFDRRADAEENAAVLAKLRSLGASATVNSYWLLGWLGGYDKLSAARRWMGETFDFDIDTGNRRCLFTGDSENDEPMFSFFEHSVGVSTVTTRPLRQWPRWLTIGSGGEGFVEVAQRLLAAKARQG
ncbi:MAG TPA: HAD-IIB family hydrolase [Patescibacteria group bacterium]|nr:HAD-IIB family hydrolase [Patescibacteria group bacterium]